MASHGLKSLKYEIETPDTRSEGGQGSVLLFSVSQTDVEVGHVQLSVMQQVVKLNICYDPDNELDNILCFHIPHHTSQFSLMSGTLSAGQTHEAAPLRGPGGCLTSKLREVGSLWNFSGPSGDKY